MREKISDGWYALGFGVVFVGYAIWAILDEWRRNRRVRADTRARLIYDDAGSRRERMEIGEWMGTRDA